MKRVLEKELDYPGRDARYHHGGRPFHGIVYSLFQTGKLERETEYRDGVPWGLDWTFRPDGVVEREGTHAAGYREGYWRTWHPNGQLATEEWCHIGLVLIGKKWDPAGTLLEDYVRPESDPYYRNLLVLRRIWGIADQPVPWPQGDRSATAEDSDQKPA